MAAVQKKPLNIVVRTDAALHIGTGHVMRCLTLANALKSHGVKTLFICRKHQGHLQDLVIANGHECYLLPEPSLPIIAQPDPQISPPHAQWLGETWQTDLQQTLQALSGRHFDWLVIDHYALDAGWEQGMRNVVDKIMVIDDLADRNHECDLLLDQTLDCKEDAYKPWVPKACTILAGIKYALLRHEFIQWREYSLARRQQPVFHSLLVNMGGIDYGNFTGKLLDMLAQCKLPASFNITVVLGLAAPYLAQVQEQAKQMPVATEVKVNVSNMAEIMANSDLAIGAAGSTSWERCCLGLPTLMLVIAPNQAHIARALSDAGAAILIGSSEAFESIFKGIDTNTLGQMSTSAAELCSGDGVYRVMKIMLEKLIDNNNIMLE